MLKLRPKMPPSPGRFFFLVSKGSSSGLVQGTACPASTTRMVLAAMGGSSRRSRYREGYRRTAEILIAHGADVNRRTTGHRGQTPLDDAVANNNDHVAAVLRKHGAQLSKKSAESGA